MYQVEMWTFAIVESSCAVVATGANDVFFFSLQLNVGNWQWTCSYSYRLQRYGAWIDERTRSLNANYVDNKNKQLYQRFVNFKLDFFMGFCISITLSEAAIANAANHYQHCSDCFCSIAWNWINFGTSPFPVNWRWILTESMSSIIFRKMHTKFFRPLCSEKNILLT